MILTGDIRSKKISALMDFELNREQMLNIYAGLFQYKVIGTEVRPEDKAAEDKCLQQFLIHCVIPKIIRRP